MRLSCIEFVFVVFLFLVVFGCTSETENPDNLNLSIKMLNTPECNQLKSAGMQGSTPISQSCIDYTFDQAAGKLFINHLNAGFNCCPESLSCSVTYRNDTIIIQEIEKHMGCKCNCLYDLEMELAGIEPGKYQLRLIEPYLGTQQQLTGTMDLRTQTKGSICVSRTNYPWGE